MKMRAPAGTTAISVAGHEFVVAEDGSVDVTEAQAEVLRCHGFALWNEGESLVPIEAMTHAQMVLAVLERTKVTLQAMSVEELRARLLATNQTTVILPDETNGSGVIIDPAKVSVEDVEGMNRIELFAFLKAKGVAVAPPIKNEDLRAYARIAIEEEAAKAAAAAAPVADSGSAPAGVSSSSQSAGAAPQV